tara:strand:+ start:130 stop:1914 length:1785 start_codon:yes stop_codon:yes gene_type:complete
MFNFSKINFCKKITINNVIFNKLKEHNVKHCFLYSGGSIMGLVDKFYGQKDIKFYVNTSEGNCGFAAIGYARRSGKTGVVLTTSGPGLTNAITPMLDAQNDSTPLLLISGNTPSIINKSHLPFQGSPGVELTKSFTKWSYILKKDDDINKIMDLAFCITQDKKKGVVHLDLPKDVGSTLYDENSVKNIHNTQTNNNGKFENIKRNISSIEEILDKINSSKKPIFYIGQGANHASEELEYLINKKKIPFTTTIHAVGVVTENHPLSLKFLGMHGSPAANIAIQESDCIIALGSRFCDRTTGNLDGFASNAKKNKGIIHINIEESEINKVINTDLNYLGDCKEFLKELIKLDNIKNDVTNYDNWYTKIIPKLKSEYKFEYKRDEKCRVQYVLECLDSMTKHEDFIITTGVGNHQMHAAQYLTFKSPKSLITSGSLGVMGFGLPAAIGVKIENPNKTVIVVEGDSSFLMVCADLKTIKENNLDIKILIINNHSQAMVKSWEKLFYNNRVTATENKYNPSFTKLADAFGINYIYCNEKNNIVHTLYKFLDHKSSIICEMDVEYDYCLPLIAPGKNLDDMILYNDNNIIKMTDMGDAPA